MRKLRMIVFDDDEVILRLFQEYFEAENYEVITSSKPFVCFMRDDIRGTCPHSHACADILITDYKMPGLDGLTLIREQIRMGCLLDPRSKAVITGMFDDRLKRETDRLGCVLFEKPLAFADLKAWVDECRKRADLARPLSTRRKELRTPTAREIARMTEPSGQLLEATVLNRSNSGLGVELRFPLKKEGLVRLDSSFLAPSHNATVRWVRKSGNGTFRVGLHYVM